MSCSGYDHQISSLVMIASCCLLLCRRRRLVRYRTDSWLWPVRWGTFVWLPSASFMLPSAFCKEDGSSRQPRSSGESHEPPCERQVIIVIKKNTPQNWSVCGDRQLLQLCGSTQKPGSIALHCKLLTLYVLNDH